MKEGVGREGRTGRKGDRLSRKFQEMDGQTMIDERETECGRSIRKEVMRQRQKDANRGKREKGGKGVKKMEIRET